MDDESLSELKRLAAEEVGLPSRLSSRVRGSTLAELRGDAKKLAVELGYAEPQARDSAGRFAMSDLIRQRAGYAPIAEPEAPAGDLGVGKGGSAAPRQVTPPSMSDLIRGVHQGRRMIAWDLAEQSARNGD
jgi:hypothetical protein